MLKDKCISFLGRIVRKFSSFIYNKNKIYYYIQYYYKYEASSYNLSKF